MIVELFRVFSIIASGTLAGLSVRQLTAATRLRREAKTRPGKRRLTAAQFAAVGFIVTGVTSAAYRTAYIYQHAPFNARDAVAASVNVLFLVSMWLVDEAFHPFADEPKEETDA